MVDEVAAKSGGAGVGSETVVVECEGEGGVEAVAVAVGGSEGGGLDDG